MCLRFNLTAVCCRNVFQIHVATRTKILAESFHTAWARSGHSKRLPRVTTVKFSDTQNPYPQECRLSAKSRQIANKEKPRQG